MELRSSGIGAPHQCEHAASRLTLTHIRGLQCGAYELGSATTDLEISPQYYSYGHSQNVLELGVLILNSINQTE